MSGATLDDLCVFINGGSWNENEYVSFGHPVLKVSNIKGRTVETNNLSFLSDSGHEKYKKNILKTNDLVIATVGSHQNLVSSAAGRTIIIKKQINGFLLNQNAVCVRTKQSEILDQKYLGYLGESSHFKHYIQVRGRGAANQMRIAVGEIKKYAPKLPSLPIQKKIAGILSAYDDLIENNLKRIKLLEEMAQITYEEWFVRLRFPGYESTTVNPETGLPEGWMNEPLGQHIKFFKGKKIQKVADENQSGLVKIMLLNSLETGIYKYTAPEKQIPTQRGDLVMCMDGARSSYVFYAEEGVVGSTMSKIQIKTFPVSLLYWFFRSNLEWLQINNTGAAIPHANKAFVNKIQFLIPTSEIIQMWEGYVSKINSQIWVLRDQTQFLQEARNILLPRLMTSMVDVENYNPADLLKEVA